MCSLPFLNHTLGSRLNRPSYKRLRQRCRRLGEGHIVFASSMAKQSEKAIWSPASDYRLDWLPDASALRRSVTDTAITEVQRPRPCTKSKNFALQSYVNLPWHLVSKRWTRQERAGLGCRGTCTMLRAIRDQWPNLSVRCVLTLRIEMAPATS